MTRYTNNHTDIDIDIRMIRSKRPTKMGTCSADEGAASRLLSRDLTTSRVYSPLSLTSTWTNTKTSHVDSERRQKRTDVGGDNRTERQPTDDAGQR